MSQNRRGTAPSPAISEFISQLPEQTRELTSIVREVARAEMKGLEEIVYHGAIGYTPNGKPGGRVVYIAPESTGINLGFFYGSELPDPDRLLTGAGGRLRHLKIRSAEEARDPALRMLLKSAATLGS